MLEEITNIKQRCQRCNNGVMVTDTETGEMVCGKCGFVVYERIEDSGPEWRSFLGDGKTDRTRSGQGSSLTRHDMGLATIINRVDRDVMGKPLAGHMKSTVRRLRILDSRSQAQRPTDRNFAQAFNELYRMKDKLVISNAVIEEAAYIYRKGIDKELVRGRSISAMMAAALYIACRDAGITRDLKDIASVSNLKRKDIARCYRLLVKEMDFRIPIVDPVQCIARIANNTGLAEKTKRFAMQILRKARQGGIVDGKNPMGLAAAALYLSCVKMGEDRTQKDISLAAHVTEVTVRNRYGGLKKALRIEPKPPN